MRAAVRSAVRELLERSPAFRQLPAQSRRALAWDVERIGGYLAAPEGIPANTIPGAVGVAPFRKLIESVDFPAFVSSLIDGVFDAIVDASIEQMSAYADLLKNVAKSADDFASNSVTESDARDYLAARYPDVFEMDRMGSLRVRDDANRALALEHMRRLSAEPRLRRLDPPTIKKTLIPAARKRIAASRQQILASMVLMGVNQRRPKSRRRSS